MSGDDSDDKQHEPTQKRLDDARKRGEIPKSIDLTTAAAYAGLTIVILGFGRSLLLQSAQVMMALLDQPDRLMPISDKRAVLEQLGINVVTAIVPLFLFPAAAVILALIGQRAIHFSPERLSLRWSRLSPMSGLRQKFGRDGLFEFGKSFAKLAVVSLVLGAQLMAYASQIMASIALSPESGISMMLKLLIEFLALVTGVIAGFGVLDYLWQRNQHLRRNRMSRNDMSEEMKDSEGDPHVKQQRRQRGQEIATNRMLQDVGKADVVVVNPTHFAVALKWNRKARGAPICVAKGTDEIAARIRERAAEAGVPVHSDPPTARAIFATVEIGQQILPDQYRAVAAAIRFAEAMRKRRKGYRK